jgi:arylsulfatase A-like enzyme
MILPPQVTNDWDDIPQRGINYVNSVNASMSEEQEKKAIAGYYASVAYMDRQVGKVLKTLKEEGLEDNTIVVFTSDHGFHLGEHRFWMKVSLHEESVKVPMIIKVPGKSAAICHSFTELVDIYPTLAELAGLETKQEVQGVSLVQTLDDPNLHVRDMAFSVSQGGKTFLIRNDKWAYIQYDEDAKSGMELFDMEVDPGQYNNLAYHPQFADVVVEMKSILASKLEEVRTNDLEITYD